MKENVREFVSNLIRGILIGSVIFVITIGIAYLGAVAENQRNEEIYNDGVCIDCGGHYKLVSISKDRSTSTTTYYYYQCDNCEKIIELRH